ncbi:NADH dehydrogenase [ubiquinone] 1 alpha subcomplex assembly factor 2 isoform X4 [Saimiri boliviensis]|uniref:NADH dehydrogenase [ubiquinone] 1 alpha subcomplex assembly factor 2 isoform X4 n=1 Tax=Saimiri boliviensis TaxID=27679 RepID=UPI003D76EE34
MGWSQDLFRYLWRSLSKEVKEHVGTDQFGNKYYYIAGYKNWRGQTIREKRIVEAVKKQEVDYESGDIPTEWEAWIRRKRKTPPTMEESLYRPGWSAVVRSHLTATSTSHVQATSPASASQVAGSTGSCHHTRLIVFLVETGFHRVSQDGLNLLTS